MPDSQAGDQQMLRLFRSPVQRQSDNTHERQSRAQRASVRARQLIGPQTRIMQEARESLAGSFKVIKESGESGLTATLHRNKCHDKIRDGFLLMSVCVWQDAADILAEASVKSIFVHRRTDARTSY
ncbi:MAG TPA: hypothetical protein VGC66_13745 [Pyrinomonadaceae bacterium]